MFTRTIKLNLHYFLNDSFAQTFHSENEFNMKARLKVETKYIPRNSLHKKTNMLVYLLRLLQHTFNRSTAVLIGSDMTNTVLLMRCDTVSLFNG